MDKFTGVGVGGISDPKIVVANFGMLYLNFFGEIDSLEKWEGPDCLFWPKLSIPKYSPRIYQLIPSKIVHMSFDRDEDVERRLSNRGINY